jgi:hypothetical protein
MHLPRPQSLLLAVAVAMTPLVGGCGLLDFGGGGGPLSAPTEDAGAKARERVQSYLDAMKAKDAVQGRSQMCTVMQATFDTAASGPNGDFAKHFTVSEAVITEVRANDGRQEVETSITVDANGKNVPVNLVFTVARTDEGWCIAGEAPATAPPVGGEPSAAEPGGGPAPSPSS